MATPSTARKVWSWCRGSGARSTGTACRSRPTSPSRHRLMWQTITAESWHWSRPDPLLDPETASAPSLRRLPPAFRDVSCGWQVSASAGFKPGYRLRTWHWLDHPCTGAELKIWLKPAIERRLVDPVTLVEAQPHYLAVTVVGGADPCPQRFGVLRLAKDAVPVPDIAGIVRREQKAERRERQREPQTIRAPWPARFLVTPRLRSSSAASIPLPAPGMAPNTGSTSRRRLGPKPSATSTRSSGSRGSAGSWTLTSRSSRRPRKSKRHAGSTLGVMVWVEAR